MALSLTHKLLSCPSLVVALEGLVGFFSHQVRLRFKWERLAVGLTHKLLSCQNVAGGCGMQLDQC
jgi:hypothetical protein